MDYTILSSDRISNKITLVTHMHLSSPLRGGQYHHSFEETKILNDALKLYDICRFYKEHRISFPTIYSYKFTLPLCVSFYLCLNFGEISKLKNAYV